MTVYILILLMMAYPFLIVALSDRGGMNGDRLAMHIACFILLFFMALRASSVGTDTKFYCYAFTQFPSISFTNIFNAPIYLTEGHSWTTELEAGYRLMNKMLSFFIESAQAITIWNSLLIIGLLYTWIRDYSPDGMFSILLYITLGVYQTEMNVSRNAIAILLVYNAMHYIEEQRPMRYILWVLAGSLVHKSVIVFLPLYFFFRHWKYTWKKMMVLILASIFIGLRLSWFIPILRIILPSSWTKYLVAGNDKPETILVGLFYVVVVLSCLYFMKIDERRNVVEKYRLGLEMFLLNLCCFGLNTGLELASRMAALFGPYLVVFIPQMLQEVCSPIRRKNVKIIIGLLCIVQYLLRMSINNIGGTMPYRFFF